MKELEIIKYLVEQCEEELAYGVKRKQEYEIARKKAEKAQKRESYSIVGTFSPMNFKESLTRLI